MIINKGFLFLFWFYFCGFYVTQITFLSPIYIVFLICFLFLFFFMIKDAFEIKLPIFVLFLSLFSILFFYQLFIAGPSFYLNLFITCISPLIVVFFSKDFCLKTSHVNRIMFFYSVLFISDFVWRFFNPALDMNVEKLDAIGYGFQLYKMNSFMYGDSNFVGLQALVFLSFYLWLGYSKFMKLNLLIVIFLCLSVFLSLSRSASLSVLIVFFVLFVFRYKKFSIILSPFFLMLTLYFFYYLYQYAFADPSFHHRFEIFTSLIHFISDMPFISLLFGVGIGNAVNYIGIGAHSLIPLLIIELGLISFFSFFLLLIWLIKTNLSLVIIIFPFLVCSTATASSAIPFFTTILTIAFLLNKRRLVIYDY